VRFVPMVIPWSVELGPGWAAQLEDDDGAGEPGLRARLLGLRERVFQELGMPLPAPRVAIVPELPEHAAVVSVREVPVLAIPASCAAPGASDQDGARAEAVVEGAHGILVQRGHELLGIGETQLLLDRLEEVNPALVRQLVPKPIALTLLTEVLRRLLEERVSIRDLRTILEGIAPLATTEKDPLALAEAARAALRRAITHALTGGAPGLEVYVLDAMLEDVVRSAITRTTAGAFLTLAPSTTREVVASIVETIAAAPPSGAGAGGGRVVILASPDVRRFFRKLIESALPDAVVTSFAELVPELQLVTRARILPR
jgi:type III secretion protein V